jgi:hypothetical protein
MLEAVRQSKLDAALQTGLIWTIPNTFCLLGYRESYFNESPNRKARITLVTFDGGGGNISVDLSQQGPQMHFWFCVRTTAKLRKGYLFPYITSKNLPYFLWPNNILEILVLGFEATDSGGCAVCGRLVAGIEVLNPNGAWLSVSCECCVLSGRGFCVRLITRLEESYRMYVNECDYMKQ